MLNSYLYRQHLNKINKYENQNLEIGLLTNILHEFWYICVLQGNMRKHTKMRNREGEFKQNTSEAQTQPMNLGQALAWVYPGLAINPPK